jgi:oligopeptide/dipeptide ABC transporter ATP-binding protein
VTAPILEARGLAVHFRRRTGRGVVRAVDGVDLALRDREFVGLVGESGCGKSTLLRALTRLVDPVAGAVLHRGRDVTRLAGRALLPLRREVQPVFQDAHAALDPRQTVGAAVAEGLLIHGRFRGPERERRVAELLSRCGLSPDLAGRHPLRLSSGERQRVGIARALSVEPRLLLADEPVASLDPPTRARILDLFLSLRDGGLGLLLVSHDLAAVAAVADRVAVMYAGRLVEVGPAAAVLREPLHPYAAALVAAVPSRVRPVPVPLPGDEPAPAGAGAGCAFHPRCPRVTARCRDEAPTLGPAGDGVRLVACHVPGPPGR